MKSAEQYRILFSFLIIQLSKEVLSLTCDKSAAVLQEHAVKLFARVSKDAVGQHIHNLVPRNLPDPDYGAVYPVGSNCRMTGCCGRKIDSLRKECAVVIPFVAALLSYMLGYGVSKYISGSASTCSSTVTTSKTLVMVQFTTSTGTITDSTTFNRITFTTALSTVYTPSVVFTTSVVTNVVVSTPTSYTLISSTVRVPVPVTSIICKGRRRSVMENDGYEDDGMEYTSTNDSSSIVKPTMREEASFTLSVDPVVTFAQLPSTHSTLASSVLSSYTQSDGSHD